MATRLASPLKPRMKRRLWIEITNRMQELGLADWSETRGKDVGPWSPKITRKDFRFLHGIANTTAADFSEKVNRRLWQIKRRKGG